MTTKHTPGPWFAHNIGLGPNGKGPYTFPLGTDPVIAEANASLIAACPELLAALRDCQQAILDIIGAADNGQPYSADELAGFAAESAEQARTAIAKATGGH